MKAGKILKKMRLTYGDILIVKKGPEVAQQIEDVMQLLAKVEYRGVTVLLVDELDEIQTLPKEQMRKHGWIKFPFAQNFDNLVVEAGAEDESLDDTPHT